MGIEIQVDSLEDMCLLMCDNVIPRKKPRREDGAKLYNKALFKDKEKGSDDLKIIHSQTPSIL